MEWDLGPYERLWGHLNLGSKSSVNWPATIEIYTVTNTNCMDPEQCTGVIDIEKGFKKKHTYKFNISFLSFKMS